MLPASLVGMMFLIKNQIAPDKESSLPAMRRARLLFHFNTIAPADAAGLDDTAQQAAPPANRFLKTLPNFVHQMARRARLRDFEQNFAGAQSLPREQMSRARSRAS